MNRDTLNPAGKALTVCVMLTLLGGCAHNPDAADPSDPYEATNRTSYAFNDSLDQHVLIPLAEGWQAITPIGLRRGLTNAFGNVTYVDTILNDILQGKLLRAIEGVGRVVLNSTLGIGGFFDVATPFGLPAQQEDFGQTLATWGVGDGNYLVIPFLGPSTQRDVSRYGVGAVTHPFFWIGGLITLPVGMVGVVNSRADLLEATRLRDEAALDPYIFTREAYRQRRNYLIHDGKAWDDDLYFDLDYDLGGQAAHSPAGVGAPAPEAAPATDGDDVLEID